MEGGGEQIPGNGNLLRASSNKVLLPAKKGEKLFFFPFPRDFGPCFWPKMMIIKVSMLCVCVPPSPDESLLLAK